ncbi:MAG: hypothetical protein JXA50_05735 [Deltaproteobacteria bacterium]|nr:hypothetical protein [Deltaproteobacteria bacterium]
MKDMKTYIHLLLLGALVISGCGRSGTWTDDSKNWQRAFRSVKPDDVVVVHSKYWRSPHFTFEFQYFFHIKTNQKLHEQLFESNSLEQIQDTNAVSAAWQFFGDKPEWFLPKPPEKYEVWMYREEPKQNFKVFIDKDNKDLFLTDYQV